MLAKRYAVWYTASVTNHRGEPCGDPKPFGHAIRRYTNEIYLERPEKHHSDPRRCGGDNSGLRHHDGKRPVADPLDGIRPRPAARQRPGAAGHGVCLRGAGVRHAGQSVQIPAPHRGGRGFCARRISWCCAGAAVVCLAAAYIYLPFAFLGVAAAFMALIVRVLKNAFAQAVHMKDELDYTI